VDRTPSSGEVVKIHQQRVCRGEIAQRGVWELPVVKGIGVFERLLPCLLASGEPLVRHALQLVAGEEYVVDISRPAHALYDLERLKQVDKIVARILAALV